MAVRIGRNWDVAISDTDASYTEIGKLKSVDGVFPTHDVIDSSNNDSAGNDEGEYGQSRTAPSFTFVYDKADAGQLELQQAAEGKSKKWFRFRPTATSGEREVRFQALITEYKLSGGTGDMIEGSCSIMSDGAVTYADQ